MLPKNSATTGLSIERSTASTFSCTSLAGGLEITVMTLTLGSWLSALMLSSIVIAPTSVDRSRPPVPIAFVTPLPMRSMIVVTSWIPVPDAPTTPMSPSATVLVNANGTLWIIPVPQSGPITKRPFSCANSFRRTSSSLGTLSENMNTCKSLRSAFSASIAA